eukprot:4840609-Amphidinium_carterae.1
MAALVGVVGDLRSVADVAAITADEFNEAVNGIKMADQPISLALKGRMRNLHKLAVKEATPGDRLSKKLKFAAFKLGADGTWTREELPGPPDFQSWWKCFRTYKTLLLLLDIVDVWSRLTTTARKFVTLLRIWEPIVGSWCTRQSPA